MSVGHRAGLLDTYGRPLEPGDEVVINVPIIGRYIVQAIRPISDVNPKVRLPPNAIRVVLMAVQDPLIAQAWKPTPLVKVREKAELIRLGIITDTGEAAEGEEAEGAVAATEAARVDRPAEASARPGPSLVLTDAEPR